VVLKGTPAVVDSTSPRYGEKASSYAAVCLETGEVEAMPLEGNSSAATSATFLQQLRAHHTTPLVVIWDNAPAQGGEPIRDYLPAHP
jgi:transposase-like protein